MYFRKSGSLSFAKPIIILTGGEPTLLPGLPELVAQLKQYSDEINDLPKGLITVLRIMRHLAVAPEVDEADGE